MDKEIHHHPAIRRIYLYIFIVTFLLFFVILAVYFSTIKPTEQPAQEVTGETLEEAPILQTEPKGTFTLSVKNNQTAQVIAGQTFYLAVNASSEGSDIVGFDALLEYDQDAFTMGQATTPLQAFQVYTTDNVDYQSLTAVLSTNGTAIPFENTEILTIPFTAKEKGKYTFSILPNVGTEITKMAESETTALFAPEVTSVQVTVN